VVKLITINDAVSEILSSLVFEQDKELKTVVNLSKTGYSLVGITNFLNKSVDMLSNKIKVDKSLGSKNTLEYINKNLKYVKSKLDSVTLNFEKTKSEGGIIDIKTEISGILSQLKEIEAKKAELSIKLNAINDLIRSYNSNLNESLNPSMVGIDDPEINQNIIKIREIENIKIEKERFYLPNSEPMKEFNRQIQNLKKEGLNRLKYYYKVFNEEQTKLESELFEINNKISNLPEREKKYLEAERAFTSASKIYEGLYNRRVEAELLLSNTDSGIRVLDQAKLFKPKSYFS
jgi:succinoglycan biosynthesis transport protein ExoP